MAIGRLCAIAQTLGTGLTQTVRDDPQWVARFGIQSLYRQEIASSSMVLWSSASSRVLPHGIDYLEPLGAGRGRDWAEPGRWDGSPRPATPWPLLPLPRPCPYKFVEKDAGGLKTGLFNQ
jgi:hypothetical protein